MTVQTYTATATWTCPAGVTSVDIECWGAGGGGGGENVYTGGGGGGYSKTTAQSVTPGVDYTVTVGSGGNAGGLGGSGTTGGDTSFRLPASTIYCLAKGGGSGGSGGSGGASASGTGGTKYSGGNGGAAGAGYAGGGGGSSAGTAANGTMERRRILTVLAARHQQAVRPADAALFSR